MPIEIVSASGAGGGGVSESGIHFQIGNGVDEITTGVGKAYLPVNFSGTITGWEIFAKAPGGSIVIDVTKDSYANFPPTGADSIAGTEKPTLTAAVKNQDLTLSTWTTSFAAGDIFGFNVDSCSGCTQVFVHLKVTKT